MPKIYLPNGKGGWELSKYDSADKLFSPMSLWERVIDFLSGIIFWRN
jgi:hypothetical protein